MNSRTRRGWVFVSVCLTVWVCHPASLEARNEPGTPAGPRPVWAPDLMPDTIWILMEASAATADDDMARQLLREAEVHARSEMESDPTDVERRFGVALVLGLRANREGGAARVRAASELHKELRTILDLDPDHVGARHLLGRLHAGVIRMNRVTRWIATNLLGGGELKKATWQEAERNLALAVDQAPQVSDYHLQLANLYRDTDRPELVMQALEPVFSIPAASPLEKAVLAEALELRSAVEHAPPRGSGW